MAHYAIGDVQGCFDELEALLAKIGFNHGCDTLWLTGDIVNRGPKSLESLKFCMKHEDRVQIILGNHDLHLLAVLYGHGTMKKRDTIEPIVKHKHADKMRDWLRHQPLLVQKDSYLMVHAAMDGGAGGGVCPRSRTQHAPQQARRIFCRNVRQQTRRLVGRFAGCRQIAPAGERFYPYARLKRRRQFGLRLQKHAV